MEPTIGNLSTKHQTKLNQFMLILNWQCGSPGKSVISQVPREHPILPLRALQNTLKEHNKDGESKAGYNRVWSLIIPQGF